MKSLFVVALLTATAAVVAAKNPAFPGWYADPDVIVAEGACWIFPTYSDRYENQTFLDAFSSKDMVTWTKHPRIIGTRAVKWAKRAMWAPCVVPKDKKYYLFFAANDVHKGEIGGIGIGVADHPQGPYQDYLGQPLINEIYNGAQPIDQCVFRDRDGQWYILYGGWGHCNLARLKADFTGLDPYPNGDLVREITPEGYVEGPMMFYRQGKYYFMWSEGAWTNATYQVAYAMADSLEGPFKRIGTVIRKDPKVATGAGHHAVLRFPASDEWLMVYHRRPPGETDGNHRVVALDRMEFNPDGTIKEVIMTNDGVRRRTLF